jgi:lipoprotein-anchoring transpeptidase ErfK/SrfK
MLAPLFVLGFACAGAFSAAVVAETLPTGTTSTASTSTATTTTATSTTVTTTTTATTATTTTAPTTTTRPAPPRANRMPDRVRIGGVPVGGLTPAAAIAAVQAKFARHLAVVVDRSRLDLDPAKLATPYVNGAVARGRASEAGTRVDLVVNVHGASIRAFTKKLEQRYERAAVDSTLLLRNGRPFVSEDHTGRHLNANAVTKAIVHLLRTNNRSTLRFSTRPVVPEVSREAIGAVIVIDRDAKQLRLYDGMKPWRTFGVATGQSVYPTPSGTFHIVVKWANPWWYPPASPWAQGLEPVPPGPGNPLGTRWMGLSAPGVGIHGTPDAASIGYSASHGCIRMLIPNAEWLFDHVDIGTTVFIV